MDTAAFLLTLLVFGATLFWYVENEMKQSDGAHGVFAVRQAEKPRKARLPRFAENGEARRYRPREAAPASPAAAKDALSPTEAPKYRRKERAWDRAAKLDEED